VNLLAYGDSKVRLSLSLDSEKPGALGFWGSPVIRDRSGEAVASKRGGPDPPEGSHPDLGRYPSCRSPGCLRLQQTHRSSSEADGGTGNTLRELHRPGHLDEVGHPLRFSPRSTPRRTECTISAIASPPPSPPFRRFIRKRDTPRCLFPPSCSPDSSPTSIKGSTKFTRTALCRIAIRARRPGSTSIECFPGSRHTGTSRSSSFSTSPTLTILTGPIRRMTHGGRRAPASSSTRGMRGGCGSSSPIPF
jgi:hypothetical protein